VRDKAMMERWQLDFDEKEIMKAKVVTDRMDKMMKVAGKYGLLAKTPREEIRRREKEEMTRALEESDAIAEELERMEKETRAGQVAETSRALALQVSEKAVRLRAEKLDNDSQAIIWQQQALEFEEENRRKRAKAADMRNSLDKALVGTMQYEMGTHGEHKVDPHKREVEIAMNRQIFEQMREEGFNVNEANTLLAERPARKLRGDHLSIPNYEHEIDPLEV